MSLRETAEASMSKTIHSTQIVTPFGSGYVPEDHRLDQGPVPALEPSKRGGRLAIALTVALFGATTAAAAISASSRNCASVPKLWEQNQPSILMKLPGYYGPDESVF
jgi:hypothetical protein